MDLFLRTEIQHNTFRDVTVCFGKASLKRETDAVPKIRCVKLQCIRWKKSINLRSSKAEINFWLSINYEKFLDNLAVIRVSGVATFNDLVSSWCCIFIG